MVYIKLLNKRIYCKTSPDAKVTREYIISPTILII